MPIATPYCGRPVRSAPAILGAVAAVLTPVRAGVVWAPLLAVAAVAWFATARAGDAAPGLMGMSPATYAGGFADPAARPL